MRGTIGRICILQRLKDNNCRYIYRSMIVIETGLSRIFLCVSTQALMLLHPSGRIVQLRSFLLFSWRSITIGITIHVDWTCILFNAKCFVRTEDPSSDFLLESKIQTDSLRQQRSNLIIKIRSTELNERYWRYFHKYSRIIYNILSINLDLFARYSRRSISSSTA